MIVHVIAFRSIEFARRRYRKEGYLLSEQKKKYDAITAVGKYCAIALNVTEGRSNFLLAIDKAKSVDYNRPSFLHIIFASYISEATRLILQGCYSAIFYINNIWLLHFYNSHYTILDFISHVFKFTTIYYNFFLQNLSVTCPVYVLIDK